MRIYGIDYGFAYTVGAQAELARLCPDGDITRLGELYGGGAVDANRNLAETACILSAWHERAASYEAHQRGESYEAHPLTEEVVDLLTIEELASLSTEVFTAMTEGRRRTVEADDDAKKKMAGSSSS